MAESIRRSICIGQECYLTFKIPIVALVVVAVAGFATMAWYCRYRSVISKDSSCTESFVFHDDIEKLLKDAGVEIDVCSRKNTAAGKTSLGISSRLDAAVALACLAQVREAKEQLQRVEARKDEELDALRASVSAAAENLEAEYGHALEAERTSNCELQAEVAALKAEVAALKAKYRESEAKLQQMAKLQTKFDRKKILAEDLKRKVFDYEKQLLQIRQFETLQTNLSEQLEECKNITHSSVDLSETNRELTSQVEQIVAKLNNEAGRIHGVAVTPQGQIRGKIVKTDNTSISMITSMSSASSAITPTQEPPKEQINEVLPTDATPKRLFRRRISSDSAKTKKSGLGSPRKN